jgi:hypothetical protein
MTGSACCIVGAELVRRLYDSAELRGDIRILDDHPYDDRRRLITVTADDLRPGLNGMREIVIGPDERGRLKLPTPLWDEV